MRLCARYQKIDKIFRIKEDKFNHRDIVRRPTHSFARRASLCLLFCISFNCQVQFQKKKEERGKGATKGELNFGEGDK